MAVKTENQQWQTVFTFLKSGLTAKKITGWTIRQGNQPSVENLVDKSIYITRIASRRYGWQAHRNRYNQTSGKMVHTEQYLQEVMFQLSAFAKRNPADLTELTSGDILNSLITFSQSIDGVKSMHALGIQSFRVTELREPAIVDDSEIYEKLPSFDISIVFVQNDESDIGFTDKYEITTLQGV